MALNIFALAIVKALGLDYPAVQLVFLRAVTGLIVMTPFLWCARHAFKDVDQLPLHALRVLLSALALTTSFFAIARLPFALFSAISFTRPVITMFLALLLLNEVVPRRRWWAAGLAFVGVYIAVDPARGDAKLGSARRFPDRSVRDIRHHTHPQTFRYTGCCDDGLLHRGPDNSGSPFCLFRVVNDCVGPFTAASRDWSFCSVCTILLSASTYPR